MSSYSPLVQDTSLDKGIPLDNVKDNNQPSSDDVVPKSISDIEMPLELVGSTINKKYSLFPKAFFIFYDFFFTLVID